MAIIKVTSQTGLESVTAKGTEGGFTITVPYSLAWTAKGYGKQAMATAAVAALVVRPSTTAMATLRNNSANKALVIERVFGHNLVAVAESEYQLWLCSHPAGMAAVTNDITVRNSTNGRAAGGSDTSFDNGATVTDDGWFIWSPFGHTTTVTTPAGSVLAEVGGRIIVPPTGGISAQVVAQTTSATFTLGFHWFEVPLTELTLT